VQFYYTQYATSGEFWQNEGKRWDKEADHFANPTKTLQQTANGIVASGDTDEVKARKIYAAVMKLDNTHFSRSKSEAERKKEKLKEIKGAEDVWKQQSGSANEIALLYIALARAAGLKVYPMQVVNRDDAIFDPTYMTTYQLDDYLAIVNIGGKEVFLDPGQKECPFGLLHWKHTLAGGLRGAEKGPEYGVTEGSTYKQTMVSRVADLTIDPDGTVKGTVRFVMSGEEALRWRHKALQNDADEVKKQFNEAIRADIPDGVQADFDHFLGLDDIDSNLIAAVKVSGGIATATGRHFFVPGLFFESHAKHPFVAEATRTIPVDVQYPKMEQDEVMYRLPAGYTVENSPATTNISWPEHALMKITSTADATMIDVSRTIAYNFTLLDPKDYSNLHDFYQKVATADQQQLVLTRMAATAAKGN